MPPCHMTYSEKDGHKEQSGKFSDAADYPLTLGSIYLFPGSVFVCNNMEKRVNGFS